MNEATTRRVPVVAGLRAKWHQPAAAAKARLEKLVLRGKERGLAEWGRVAFTLIRSGVSFYLGHPPLTVFAFLAAVFFVTFFVTLPKFQEDLV